MKKSLPFLPALASLTLMSCTMTGATSEVSATQSYGVGCVPVINAVAAAAGDMPIPDADFRGVNYRFANRASTELTLYARSNGTPRETWSEWTCVENSGKVTLNVKTSGLSATSANKLHAQFFSALNLPRP